MEFSIIKLYNKVTCYASPVYRAECLIPVCILGTDHSSHGSNRGDLIIPVIKVIKVIVRTIQYIVRA